MKGLYTQASAIPFANVDLSGEDKLNFVKRKFALNHDLIKNREEERVLAKRIDIAKWLTGDFRLERPGSSKIASYHDWLKGEISERLYEDFLTFQHLVIEHDWPSVLEDAPLDGEVVLPFDRCCFEFKISGKPVFYSVPGSIPMIATLFGGAWHTFVQEDIAHVDALRQFCKQHVDAACVMLDSEVAVTEVVRAPHRLKVKRERSGKAPLPDYRVVKLNKRSRGDLHDNPSEGTKKRLHFRRGHWRHFENHKTWINWQLVGNPDLGFVDKQYRL